MGLLRSIVHSTSRALGYTVIPTWRFRRYAQSNHLRRLLDYCRIEIVIDAGANEGQYRDYLRSEVGFAGEIISIEPIPELVSKLRGRAADDPNWQIVGCALAANEGTATLNIMRGNKFSSLRNPQHNEIGLFTEQNSVVERVEVQTRTLNQIIRDIPGAPKRNIYLKLDTQGFDLEALKGGSEALHRVAALQTEVSFKRIYEGAPKYAEMMDFLHELAFDLSAAFPNNDGHFPVLVEMDFYFISQDLVPERHRSV